MQFVNNRKGTTVYLHSFETQLLQFACPKFVLLIATAKVSRQTSTIALPCNKQPVLLALIEAAIIQATAHIKHLPEFSNL